MKSLKYFLFSLMMLSVADKAIACGVISFSPGEYYMYRVYELKNVYSSKYDVANPGAGENCRAWQKLTSTDIPLDDIYHAVYKTSLEDLKKVYANKNVAYKNRFLEWVTKKDHEILDFLILAKTNEEIRLYHSSRWYYPTMNTGDGVTLELIIEKALAVKDARLRDRYLLQAVRALFTLERYKECVALWNVELSLLPEDNLVKRLVQPYIAGAEYRLNNSEKAIEYYAQIGDVESVLYCKGRAGEKLSPVDAVALVCESAPNSKYVWENLQTIVRKIEFYDSYYNYYDFYRRERQKLYSLSLKMAEDPRVEVPALWYYTAAFLSTFENDIDNSLHLLKKAENSRSTGFLDESIYVLRIYMDAKAASCDEAYDKKLFGQLVWLDKKICKNVTDEVCKDTGYGVMMKYNCSYYYWNDMMRRVLLSVVCPKMLEAGRTTRALQLANMADNYLHSVIDKVGKDVTMEQYRYAKGRRNEYDYSNWFFSMIDTVGLDAAKKYLHDVHNPVSSFDRYLNARGYTGNDYLNDIVGTQCLRNMRYAEAMHYLSAVGEAYEDHHNLYMDYDPFSVERVRKKPQPDFKYRFAARMHSLEQMIEEATDPNLKAQHMVTFAVGLKNSFDFCWELTQYAWGYGNYLKDKKCTKPARDRVYRIITEACGMITDDELAANINYEFCNFETVAIKYPSTSKGRLVRGSCDVLYDYNAQNDYRY